MSLPASRQKYSSSINKKRFDKYSAALMLYYNGDAAKTNKFLDTTTERDVKMKYRAWAKGNIPPTVVDEKTRIEEAFFRGLLA